MGKDPDLTRLLTRRFDRRALLRAAGGLTGAAALAPILAACSARASGPWAGSPAGVVNFANWPLYIDRAKAADGTPYTPSLQTFTETTGIEVNYRQVIDDPEAFYQAIRRWLVAGDPTGWDIMVITNGQTLTEMIKLDYLMELPRDRRPHFDANASPIVVDPDYDPGNRFTMAWQSGITGIAYNIKLTGREITSLSDLFDPAFAGRVGMFGDVSDLPNLTLLANGAEPETSTAEDWRAAAALLAKQRSQHIVHGYYRQNYIKALRNGEVALTMAWSGDIFQEILSGSTDLRFVVPEEGAILWTDTMCIPKNAEHPLDAITLMDFVYRPDIAGQIASWVQYIAPVPKARDVIVELAKEAGGAEANTLRAVADSPLVFPGDADVARLHTYRVFENEAEQTEWTRIFAPYQA